jgi:hypothetical protein
VYSYELADFKWNVQNLWFVTLHGETEEMRSMGHVELMGDFSRKV